MPITFNEDVIEHLESDPEKAMRDSFNETIEEILDEQEEWDNDADYSRVGMEIELFLGDPHPVDEQTRDGVIGNIAFADCELGASQVELRADPRVITSLDQLANSMRVREEVLREEASKQGLSVIRSGAHPFGSIDNPEITTTEEKYQVVPPFNEDHRHDNVPEKFPKGRAANETIDPRDVDLLSLFSSIQPNVEADSLEDAVEKANRSYMIGPYIMAAGTNAQFVGGKNVGADDVRTEIWNASHDIRSEESYEEDGEPLVGRIDEFLDDIEDYASRVAETPFMLNEEEHRENAVGIGNGTYWKDYKIKFNTEDKEVIVEFRPLSVQPTIERDVAMTGFYLGRLAYSQAREGPLEDMNIGIEEVNQNREQVWQYGLDADLVPPEGGEPEPAYEVVRREIDKARTGLEEELGINPAGYLDFLEEDLEYGNPSDIMEQVYEEARSEGKNREEALMDGLNELGAIY